MQGYLFVRGKDKGDGRGAVFLSADPRDTGGEWTYAREIRHAYRFDLDRLPELLFWVRRRRGFAVLLYVPEQGTFCSLAERNLVGR